MARLNEFVAQSDKSPVSYAQIMTKIREVLSSWPLYREFRYTGNALIKQVHEMGSTLVLLLPEIELFCPTCKKHQRWASTQPKLQYREQDVYYQREYVCKNCSQSDVHYFIRFRQIKAEGSLVKVGQYPALEATAPPELNLESDDLALYRKALTSRNNTFGIGALAYLRRVVENRMNSLLDLVADAAKQAGTATQEQIGELATLRQNGRFEDKAKLAGAILPQNLKPGGHNPFDVISKFASEGIHALSDDECIVVFDKVRLVFEYLFRELTVQSDDAKRFIEDLSRLAGQKPGRKVTEKQKERSKPHDGDELAEHQEP